MRIRLEFRRVLFRSVVERGRRGEPHAQPENAIRIARGDRAGRTAQIVLAGGEEQRVGGDRAGVVEARSEEHASELQSLMRISSAVFCLKKKINNRSKEHTYELQSIKPYIINNI